MLRTLRKKAETRAPESGCPKAWRALCLRPRVSARDPICRRRQRYFFLALALLLLAVFDLVADLAALLDLHPQRLHAISAPFQKCVHTRGTICPGFIGYPTGDTLTGAALS